MKKLSLLAFVALFAIAAQAQTNTDNITASAVVQATITVTANENLDFGTFADGATSTQDLTTANVANLGLFTISGQSSGANIDFILNTPTILTAAGAFDDLPYAATATVTGTSGDVNGGSDYTLDGSGDGTVGVTGAAATDYYVYVGGTVDASLGGADYSGSYSGTITLTVNYQ